MKDDQKAREEFENKFKGLLRAWYSNEVFYYKSPLIKGSADKDESNEEIAF